MPTEGIIAAITGVAEAIALILKRLDTIDTKLAALQQKNDAHADQLKDPPAPATEKGT